MRTLWIECGSSQAPALRDSKVCSHCRFYYFPFRNLFYRPSGVSHVVDSQSTIFISKAVTSIRRTVWLERRAIVLREYVESREFIFIKIAGELNIADGLTKPMTQATYKLHLSYSHPYAGLSDEERQVVSDTFHRLANMPLT